MNLASLASQHMGMPEYICNWYLTMLQSAKYYIQLPNQTSEEYYTNTDQTPIHGPGQGSRAAPSIWVLVSNIIMESMKIKSSGILFSDPTQQHTFQHIMTGFVDDTTHWVNNFNKSIKGQYTQQDMYQEIQQTAQWWEQLLSATGGKLELQKCFY